jgi:quercetin dioxygenase-like cupin family protein
MSGPVRRAERGFDWPAVELLRYKAEGSAPFRDVSRRVLFQDPGLACELRYFEVQAGGYTTLERHQHGHAVMILRGRGACLIGTEIHALEVQDLVRIAAMTWHQFRASDSAPLGFLCMVNAERDRPQLPGSADLAALRADPRIAEFIRS